MHNVVLQTSVKELEAVAGLAGLCHGNKYVTTARVSTQEHEAIAGSMDTGDSSVVESECSTSSI